MARRKTTSLGTIRSCLRYAIMFDGARYTVEHAMSGALRRACALSFDTDEEARQAAPQKGVVWRSIGVMEGVRVTSARHKEAENVTSL